MQEIAKRIGRYILMTLTENNPLLGIVAILIQSATSTFDALEVYVYYFKKIIIEGKTIRQSRIEYSKRDLEKTILKAKIIRLWIKRLEKKEENNARRIRKTNRKRNSRIKIPDVSDSQNFNQNGIIKP